MEISYMTLKTLNDRKKLPNIEKKISFQEVINV